MGQIKWYKRDPSAALNGMMELSLEERGAYNTVLDLIYSRDGNLHDDDRFIAGWLRVDVRIWKRIKSTLIDRKKLYVDGDFLRNERADAEVLSALSRVGSARDAGLASARSKASKSNVKSRKNRTLAPTDVGTSVSTPVSTNYNHNQIEEEGKPSSPSVRENVQSAQGDNLAGDPHAKPKGVRKAKVASKDRLPEIELPEWLPGDAWVGFIEMRVDKGSPPTERALKALIKKLDGFRGRGHDPTAVLDQSTINRWTDLYELKDRANANRNQDHRGSAPRSHPNYGSDRAPAGFLRRALEPESGEVAQAAYGRDDRQTGGDGELPFAPARALPGA